MATIAFAEQLGATRKAPEHWAEVILMRALLLILRQSPELSQIVAISKNNPIPLSELSTFQRRALAHLFRSEPTI